MIHNFKIAYEVTYKTMKYWLETNISPEIVVGVTRKEFYHIAAENWLISDVEKWLSFHEGRNKTSHTYDGIVAEDVFCVAMDFLAYAQDFVKKLFADVERGVLKETEL